MPKRSDLIETLHKIEHILHESEEIGRQKLEELGEQAMRAFDGAIQDIDHRINARSEIRRRHLFLRQWKKGFFRTLRPISAALRHLVSMPFIYGLLIPTVLFHLSLEIYHQISFRLYRIPLVDGRDYFVFDRARLPYLNLLEKLNCLYCSYFNNLMPYCMEIAGRTERYWCPIKYANRLKKTHSQYELFIDYLEADTFRERWEHLRDFSDLKKEEPETHRKGAKDRKGA